MLNKSQEIKSHQTDTIFRNESFNKKYSEINVLTRWYSSVYLLHTSDPSSGINSTISTQSDTLEANSCCVSKIHMTCFNSWFPGKPETRQTGSDCQFNDNKERRAWSGRVAATPPQHCTSCVVFQDMLLHKVGKVFDLFCWRLISQNQKLLPVFDSGVWSFVICVVGRESDLCWQEM